MKIGDIIIVIDEKTELYKSIFEIKKLHSENIFSVYDPRYPHEAYIVMKHQIQLFDGEIEF